MLEQPRHEIALGGERNEAVPDIARRKRAASSPETPGATPVIGHRHDRGHGAQLPVRDQTSQAAENRGKAGAAP
jgi:hypothetical protein